MAKRSIFAWRSNQWQPSCMSRTQWMCASKTRASKLAAAVFEQQIQRDRVADADLIQARIAQRRSRPFLKRPAQPAADGHGQAALAPMHDGLGQVTQGVAFQKCLGGKTSDAFSDRQV